MDRFTRTREHYARALHRSHQSQTAATPPAADFLFDFDFKDSKLDLNLDVGNPAVQYDSTMRCQIDPSEAIGVAIPYGPPSEQQGRLDCPVTAEDGQHYTEERNERISSVPEVPNETHIKFSARCEEPSRNLPLCSIYSKQWREHVRRTVTPPEQMSDRVSADYADTFLKETSSDKSKLEGSDPESGSESDQESSPLPQETCPKDVDGASEGQPLPASILLESNTKENGKRLLKIWKWLLRPTKCWDKRPAVPSTNTSVETMLSNTITPCCKPSQGTSNQYQYQRIGEALRTRVAQKQAEAQDQISLPQQPTGSLRGGGSFVSVSNGRRWDNDPYNRHRSAHRHSSSSGSINRVVIYAENEDRLGRPVHHQPRRPRTPGDPSLWPFPRSPQNRNQDRTNGLRPPTRTPPGSTQTRTPVQRGPGRPTQSHDDRRGQGPERGIRRSSDRRPEHRTQTPGEQGPHLDSRPTSSSRTEDASPRELSEEPQNFRSTRQSDPGSHRTTTSGPPLEFDRRPKTSDDPNQTISQVAHSQPRPDTNSAHGTSIRISLGDGRVLSTPEYNALQEKRAGKRAARVEDTDQDRNASGPGAGSKAEEPQRGPCPASKEEGRANKSIFAEPSPKEIQIRPASQRGGSSGKSSTKREPSWVQQEGMVDKTQSRKPELARSSIEDPSRAAAIKVHPGKPRQATVDREGKKAASSVNVELDEHSRTTTIADLSSRHPSTRQQERSPPANASSQQSLGSTSSLRGRNSGVPGPARQQSTATTRAGEISIVDRPPLPNMLSSHPVATHPHQGTTTDPAQSTCLRSSDNGNGNGPRETATKEDSTGDAEGEPTWSFANLRL
ncbi:uncharacterized protein Z520_11396 [Fonsecaea multimorphosa CBS 102226]|uniref:Uncharacterized protein n=1 Tax=Fonsecaea multimorphosa CBS 102226 TaxID=1442371 RepID=A0A0D2GTY5_9EURO|nr:uncharacterized protein Z520_11396 [Fonsecaea multimorphosa CBS 102226]KIX92920.1 hypothetical protein Z520_11396 [Fonsecaea multimorphosa CBS 102226]